jgi:hypothetical protein
MTRLARMRRAASITVVLLVAVAVTWVLAVPVLAAWTIIGVRELADRRRRRDLAAVLLRRLAEQDATQAAGIRRVNTEFAAIVAPLADLDGLDRTLTDLYLIPTQRTGGAQ